MNPPTASPPRGIIAVITDLLFATRVSETAKSLGIPIVTVRPDALVETASRVRPERVLVDMTSLGDPASAIAALRGAAEHALTPIIAFHPHVFVEMGDAARGAGATHVLPRSAFNSRLVAILRGSHDAANPTGAVPKPGTGC